MLRLSLMFATPFGPLLSGGGSISVPPSPSSSTGENATGRSGTGSGDGPAQLSARAGQSGVAAGNAISPGPGHADGSGLRGPMAPRAGRS